MTGHAYRSFGIYSGRFDADGVGGVYEDTGGLTSVPVASDGLHLFLDLCAGGVTPSSVVSVYVRHYANGEVCYLGPQNRWRRMPRKALSAWHRWLGLHGKAAD